MGAAAEFVARGLAGQVHGLHLAGFHQLLDVAVHRGQTDGRHLALRCAQDFSGEQGRPASSMTVRIELRWRVERSIGLNKRSTMG